MRVVEDYDVDRRQVQSWRHVQPSRTNHPKTFPGRIVPKTKKQPESLVVCLDAARLLAQLEKTRFGRALPRRAVGEIICDSCSRHGLKASLALRNAKSTMHNAQLGSCAAGRPERETKVMIA